MPEPDFVTTRVLQLLWAMRGNNASIKALQLFLKESDITKLSLRGHRLMTDDTTNLCRALKVNDTVIHLDLGLCCIDVAGAFYLQRLLEANTSLRSLDLERNPLCAAGANLLAEGLKRNTMLQRLNLRQNQIGSVGANHLAVALVFNKKLISLNLALNGISQGSGRHLANALKENHTLSSLNLEDNQLGCLGIESLTKVLKENPTLTWLHVGSNQMKDDGAQALIEVLQDRTNHCIQRPFVIHVTRNLISSDKLKALQAALALHEAYLQNIGVALQPYFPVDVATLTIDYLSGKEWCEVRLEEHCQRSLKRLKI